MSKNFFSLICLAVACFASNHAVAAQKLISGVPNYDQDIFPIDQQYRLSGNDCLHIACTMLNGYYDAHGWPRLIPYGGNNVTADPLNPVQPYVGNAWGIDTVVLKYKAEFGFNADVPKWRIILGQLGNAIINVVDQCDPGASFASNDDEFTDFPTIQSHLNADHPCVLAVVPYKLPFYGDNSYEWEGSSTLEELPSGHAVCAVGWSDDNGHWVICNMGWSFSYSRAWFNSDSDDDWYISQVTPGGSASSEDDDAYEDNDIISQARQVFAGTANNLRCLDTLIVNNDYKASYGDWYKVNVSAGQSLSTTISFTHASGDLDLRVYSPSQSFVGSSEGSGNSESVNVASTSAGYYYIFVYGYNNAKNQNYSLTVSVVSPPSAINLSCAVSPSSGSPSFPFTVSGSATYNNGGGGVAVGTATITVGGQTYTAAINNGNYSRTIYAPSSPGTYAVSVSASDGVGHTGSASSSVTVNSNGSTSSYTINGYLTCKTADNADPWMYHNAIDAFGSDDSRFYVWWEMVNLTGQHSLQLQLYRPDGTLYDTDSTTFGDNGITYDWWRGSTYWEINGYDISDLEGRWTVKLYVDGSYKRTITFTVRYEFKEHRMCKNHQTSDPYDPITPTSIFTQTDVKAETWCKLDKVSNPIEMKWQWYEPNGSQYAVSTHTSDNPNSEGYDYYDWAKFWGNIDIQGNSAANKCGDWRVDVYIKDAFGNWDKEYTDYFRILEAPNQPPSCTVTLGTPNPIPGQTVALNVAASDNTYLKDVVLHWKDGSEHSNPWNNVIASSLNQNFNIGSFAAGQQVEFWTVATDTSGNTTESSHLTVLVRAAVIRPIIKAQWTNNTATISVPTQVGYNYTLEFKNSLNDAAWTSLQSVAGNGSQMTLTDVSENAPSRVYRVRVQ